MPTSTACLLPDAGLDGCAVEDQTEQGHMTVNEADWDVPFSVAVTTAVSSPLGVVLAAVTGKEAVEELAGTVTEAGAVTAGLLPESDTAAPPFGARAERVTVQVALAPALRFVGLQARVETTADATRFKVAVCEAPFKVAVIVALWLEGKAPAVAMKEAELAPATTATVAGTLRLALLLASATLLPPAGAAWFRATVQVLAAPEFTVPGLQVSSVKLIGAAVVIVAPVAVVAMARPAAEVLIALMMFSDVAVVAGEIVTLMTAATPFWMLFVFSPVSRQV